MRISQRRCIEVFNTVQLIQLNVYCTVFTLQLVLYESYSTTFLESQKYSSDPGYPRGIQGTLIFACP